MKNQAAHDIEHGMKMVFSQEMNEEQCANVIASIARAFDAAQQRLKEIRRKKTHEDILCAMDCDPE